MHFSTVTRRRVASAIAASMVFGSVPAGATTYELRQPLQGVAAPASAADVSATPGSLTFSSLIAGQSSTQDVTFNNAGGTAAPVARVLPTAPFSMTDNCGDSLAPGSSCSATVTYAPTAAGAHVSTAGIAGASVSLSGQAVAPQPTAVLSGAAGANTAVASNLGQVGLTAGAVTRYVYLRNTGSSGTLSSAINLTSGSGAFSIASVWATRDDEYNWSSANCQGSGNALTECTAPADGSSSAGHKHLRVEVRFDPSVAGPDSATLSFAHNGSTESPVSVVLTGEGTEPQPTATVSGTSGSNTTFNADLGKQSTTAGMVKRFVYLRNTGGQGILKSDVKMTSGTGAFTVVSVWATRDDDYNWSSPNCKGSGSALTECTANADGSSVNGHRHLRVEVGFDPSVVGTDTATLELAHNGTNSSPIQVTLTGEGITPPPVVALSGAAGSTTTFNTDMGKQSVTSGAVKRYVYLRNTGSTGILTSDVKLTSTSGAFTIASVWATRDDEYNWSSAGCQGSGNTLTACTAPADASSGSGHKHLRIELAFDPSVIGVDPGATLELKHNGASGSPITLSLTGEGISPPPSVALSGTTGSTTTVNTNLGQQGINAGAVIRSVYLRNTGTSGILKSDVKLTNTSGAITIDNVWTIGDSGGNWAWVSCGTGNTRSQCSAAVDASNSSGHKHLRIDLRFDPSVAAPDSARLELAHNGTPTGPITVDFTAEGIDPPPTAVLSGTTGSTTAFDSNMGTVNAASGSVTRSVYLRNTATTGILTSDITVTGGNGAFTIVSVWAIGDSGGNWSGASGCAGSSSARTACSANADGSSSGHKHLRVDLRFDPVAVGSEQATLEFKHNGSNGSPTTVTLTGSGS